MNRTFEENLKLLEGFVCPRQLATIKALSRGEERQFFIEKMAELATTIETMPKTYEQDGKGLNAVAHLHYFSGGADFYITEKDMEAEQYQAFGLVSLSGNEPEQGYINLVELAENGVEIDLHFTPKPLAEIIDHEGPRHNAAFETYIADVKQELTGPFMGDPDHFLPILLDSDFMVMQNQYDEGQSPEEAAAYFIELEGYMAEIDRVFQEKYAITIIDAGLESDRFQKDFASGTKPQDFVQQFAEKYDLTPADRNPFAPRTTPGGMGM